MLSSMTWSDDARRGEWCGHAGELRVAVGATFPLERAADAHRAVEAGQAIGKTVLTLD